MVFDYSLPNFPDKLSTSKQTGINKLSKPVHRSFSSIGNPFYVAVVSLVTLLQTITFQAKSQTPYLSSLTPTPRANFTPTPPEQKGYWNADVVGDFSLPASKTMTFCGAGRNLHANQDREKLFRRGFTAIEASRMTIDEKISGPESAKPPGWTSPLKQSQRALIVYQNYLYYPPDNPFNLLWARRDSYAPYTYFRRPPGDPYILNSVGAAMDHMAYECAAFGDCQGAPLNTFGHIFMDIENDYTYFENRQQNVNLYAYMMYTLRKACSPATQIGSIGPVPHNNFGFTRYADYDAGVDWGWSMPAQHTDAVPDLGVLSSRQRGMPDAIVGKSFSDYVDFQMPGVYYTSMAFDYSYPHNGEMDTHWLASVLGEQEINSALSPKKRIAWQWMFNTQSPDYPNSPNADYPVPPVMAEGHAIFYWLTGADGVLFWDDEVNLTPNRNSLPPGDPNKGLGSDRNYACYEHYIHGTWRLFNHHKDMFNGRERYLNQETECSFDKGLTWHKYNAGDLKRKNLPFARAMVNGNQILIAATAPYVAADKKTSLMVRYIDNNYQFTTEINLTGDEIYLGRATMSLPPKVKNVSLLLCQDCVK
ncbi:hypothetical protein [Spirosoma spitsbergense]|jgi:hypothetical protein|uniref:hypothetical protein n=1 Tax=Spirosoma spitsbergense TaxID=431554 RepID=UPI00036350B2|nr:hypothetical protein [Spirosoma spitsbergense]